GVPTEVLEELRRPGERPFGVHDPVMPAKIAEPGGEGLRIRQRGERAGEAEPAGGEGAVKRLEVFAAEDPGEGADGEQKAGRRGDPARAVLGERAAGHDTVQMQVLGEILAPGVEDRGAADVPPEVARIAAKGGERRGDRAEE